MAKVAGDKVQLDNGQLVTPQTGGWYDGQQYWNGALSNPGQINTQSNQVGAGQAVSKEVIAQTNPANVPYIQAQQQKANYAPTYAPTPGTPSSVAPTTGATGAITTTDPTGLNLPNLYDSLYKTAGIDVLEVDFSNKTKAYNEATSKINDNPFLSEASRVGRVQKLTTDFNNSIANVKNDIATKKADIETRLNLETKQFDINSQVAKDALNKANTLLEMGALDTASGEDIANLVRSTGISSQAWYSAIKARQEKNISTSISQVDDGKNIYSVVINSKTGEIIAKTAIGTSKPAAAKEPKAQTAGEQKASVKASITSYLGSQQAQNNISPEDLYQKLISSYPEAFDYIEENWTPLQIRQENGEKV